MPQIEENTINLFISFFAVAFSVGAAYFDFKTRKIPNKYNLVFFILALSLRGFLFFIKPQYLFDGLIGLVLGFIVFFPFFIFRFAGAGDIKLLAVLGLMVGYKDLIWIFSFTTLFHGLTFLAKISKAIFLVLVLPNTINQKFILIKDYMSSFLKTPYAIWVALGCLANLFMYIWGAAFKALIESMFINH